MISHKEIIELMAETIQERRDAISATAKSTQEHEKSEFGVGFSIRETDATKSKLQEES